MVTVSAKNDDANNDVVKVKMKSVAVAQLNNSKTNIF